MSASSTNSAFQLALVGSPNSGKSTLFNALTGLRSKVANYPGVTVERHEGTITRPNGQHITITDLPGTYSLETLSPEEQVTVDVLEGKLSPPPRPEGVLFIADSTTLSRTLPQLGDLLLRMEQPVALVLTMIDELKARGGKVNPKALQAELGIPVIGIVGNKGIGLDDLYKLLDTPKDWSRKAPKTEIPHSAEERFVWGDALLTTCYQPPTKGTPLTDRLDSVLLHPVWGLFIFAAVMVFFFQSIFAWAAPVQDLMEQSVLQVGKLLQYLPDSWFRKLLIDGVVAGVGGVVVFIPQIALLFMLISLLEQSGYMSRAVFLIDRLMGRVGLDGRSFVSMLSSYACAIPGIMAARSIPDQRSRLVTILVSPLMTCSARLPVYTLLITAFIPAQLVWGFFNLQGLVMLGLYVIGALSALLLAFVLRKGPMHGQTLPFYIELPPYRLPTLNTMAREVWTPVSSFIRRAGTLILGASIILWVLLNFPNPTPPASVTKQGAQAVQAYKLEKSVAATLGKTIEPVIAPLGFDWKIGVGLVASIAAREVIVATMAQTYAIKMEGDDIKALTKNLPKQLNPPGFKKVTQKERLAVALSLLVFFIFALQCFSTLAVMKRETGGWKWPTISFFSMTAMAYISSFVTFRLALWLL
ncbi:MAG TPA: ferrous iron transporter B [Myxococcales bacterium]|nr:ferrous iron transporter B [Deltaproteobacteria bacterium]HAA58861.1 ferrous iron transporter B [Myxococcales bacterium]|tara:strand:- start:20811 stop:22736 length:1926 start_codon:yes stop_codon:yes gene_type:complete